MDAKQLRDLKDAELTAHIANARKEIFGLRFRNATGELENTAGLGAARREIARALTVARERQIDIEPDQASTPVELSVTPDTDQVPNG